MEGRDGAPLRTWHSRSDRLAAFALCAWALSGPGARAQSVDALEQGFTTPPNSAKPRVWWHWIDGNVTTDGIVKDLDWLSSVGIGGVHNFDAALAGGDRRNQPVVQERVAYLTPRWQETFRFAVTEADKRGMEFTIAASPGWSESGGPWVKPAQGMKKFVWTELGVAGGQRVSVRLPQPSTVTGPFQNVANAAVPFAEDVQPASYYADAAVVAFQAPVAEATPAEQPAVVSSAGVVEGARLSDGDFATPVTVSYGDGQQAWLAFEYSRPTRMASATVSVARPAGGAPSDRATGGRIWLEASNDGLAFRRISEVPRDGAPAQTIDFAPVMARWFRLVMDRPAPAAGLLDQLSGRQAVPVTAAQVYECAFHSAARVHRFEDKAAFSNRAVTETDDTMPVAGDAVVDGHSVIDLTGKMRADGQLDWVAPAGHWVVVRLGYSLTGRTNHPASREGTGLEVDKLNAVHVKSYFDSYFAEYSKALPGDLIGRRGLQFMLTDSYEAGIANWTDDILQQFRRRRGYDARPWLPVLAGYVVRSAQQSDRFLWDFRETLADLMADAHYGELSRQLHAHGMGRYGESHESGRAFTGDGMQVKKTADVPMGALWSSTLGQPREMFDADIRESASVAHIYGQNLVAAESLTAFGNTFAFTPETLKPYADRELAMGLNRFVIHTSVHQPDDRLGPGVTLGPFGQWFTRHETWAAQARPWVSYLARSSYLLQQGRFVADIAYLYGEDNNITSLFGRAPPPIPRGFNFDYVNADALVHLFTVKDGALTVPSGMRYRVLALDASTNRMTLPVLRKIRDLVNAGATVIGGPPKESPSVADSQKEFSAIVREVWGAGAAKPTSGRRIIAESLADGLRTAAVSPDCVLGGAEANRDVRWVHRTLPDADLYFIANGSDGAQHVEASFRVTGFAPELWLADSGTTAAASYRMDGGRTMVPLDLDRGASVFVVFRKRTLQTENVVLPVLWQSVPVALGPWQVQFQPGHGAPNQVSFDRLASWAENADPGVKYYSGTATYTTVIDFDGTMPADGTPMRLNLGVVKDLAEVTVNGRALGILWKAPFVADVTGVLRAGRNEVSVKVTNVWPNRIIGDKQPGATTVSYQTFDPFKADSPLLPAGLLGPVQLEMQRSAAP